MNSPVVTMATAEQIETIGNDKVSLGKNPMVSLKLNNLPGDCVLIIFERCSHSHGETYERRYTAVPKGVSIITPEGRTILVQKNQTSSFLDSNSSYYFKLPKGSWEFVKDRWFPRRKMHYDY
jgi:hypothetical protein